MGYNAAAAVPPLQNLAGVKAGRISGLAVTKERDETVPTVTSSPAFISIPTHDADGNSTADTYREGAEIRVQTGLERGGDRGHVPRQAAAEDEVLQHGEEHDEPDRPGRAGRDSSLQRRRARADPASPSERRRNPSGRARRSRPGVRLGGPSTWSWGQVRARELGTGASGRPRRPLRRLARREVQARQRAPRPRRFEGCGCGKDKLTEWGRVA